MNDALEVVTDLSGIGPEGYTPQDEATETTERIAELLKQRKFKPGISPPPIRPIYTLNGHTIATPGNLMTITSTIKTGKSAVIAAMAAAAMTESKAADLLGFQSSNPKGFALLHFDSEQSPDDHWHAVNRALQRASVSEPPAWFYSYCLTGLDCLRAWACVCAAIETAKKTHGGVHSVLIDGVADLVGDVNDPAECNGFVSQLHDTAIQNDCPIVGVIHFNPGSEKTRGHLGSQLERKAETNLRLDKADGITTMWSDKQRRAPIPKEAGPCFQWSDEAGMHVSVATREVEANDHLRMLRDEVFADHPSMRYSDIISTIKNSLKVSESTAQRKFKAMSNQGLVKKFNAMLWVKND